MTCARVLVAEDDPDVCDLFRMTLERDGHHVVTSEDGLTALARFRQEAPDIMVLDWSMPGMTGPEVLKTLSASGELRDTRVIMVTGNLGGADKLAASNAGVDEYLNKPVGIDRLREAVRRVLAARNCPSPETAEAAAPARILRMLEDFDAQVATPRPPSA